MTLVHDLGSPRLQNRLIAAAGLAVFLGGLAVAVALGRDQNEAPEAAPKPTTTVSAKPDTGPPAKRIRLTAVGALDPEGDSRENDELAVLAVDGDAATAWQTERYTSFFKTGVGLVLDAGRQVAMKRVRVQTDTPGFTAELRVGGRREGPFRRIAGPRVIQATTTIPLGEQRARYLVVWVTKLPNGTAADISEVVLTGH